MDADSHTAHRTKANGMADGITGNQIFGDPYENRPGVPYYPEDGMNAANNGRYQDGPLISSDDPLPAPFPRDSVRPLQTNAGGMGMLQQSGNNGGGLHQPVTLSFVKDGNENFVDLEMLVDVLQFKNYEKDENGGRLIGDNDVFVRLMQDSTEAQKDGKPMKLATPPKMINGKLMVTATAASDLFGDAMVYEVGQNGLQVFPSDTDVAGRDTDSPDNRQVDPALDFADDPNDPFKGDDAEGAFGPQDAERAVEALEAMAGDPEAIPALKNININALISTSKKYLGVKYKFGAKPYPQSNRFDCSSYTRYVYGKYGIDLPRTAREQMRVGTTVSRKNLRKGDLLYFYVPGRFKSNKVAGHVGIYIGNRMMIHANTEPKNGVQLRSIDRAFWKETFLTAKRVAY
ncbi:NlpC/P60 family protein [Paenibacillus sp. TRM 82003]|nr:NlpC/P60 family protein [Paenibacillus sp. TRM 82003]